jgi:hypothetical protein
MSRLGFDSFPTWRKIVIICSIATTCVIGASVAFRELDVYSSAAVAPNAATGELFPVHLMHGYVRYLTAPNYEHLMFWRPLVGVPVLLMVLAMVTSREFRRAID